MVTMTMYNLLMTIKKRKELKWKNVLNVAWNFLKE